MAPRPGLRLGSRNDQTSSYQKLKHLGANEPCRIQCSLQSLLQEHGYDGFVNVEVGGHIRKQPGYDPIGTARHCYERMSSAFKKAGLPGP